MSADPWAAASFEGAAEAHARSLAELSPTERVELLEQLLDLAITSGAVQRERAAKQRALDKLWAAPEHTRPAP